MCVWIELCVCVCVPILQTGLFELY